MSASTVKLSPTETLVTEVLAARYRLGHPAWTFHKSAVVTKALDWLAEKGLVGYKSGVVEKTYLAWLTPAGRDLVLNPDYAPPLEAGH